MFSIHTIILLIVMLFVLPVISYRHLMPASFAVAVSFPLLIGWHALGNPLFISADMAFLSTIIIFILAISTALSPLPGVAVKNFILYCGAVVIGISSAGHNIWDVILFCACVHSLALFKSQNLTPVYSDGSPAKPFLPWGRGHWLCGNSNFAGTILAPCFFISVHMGYWPVSILLIAGLIKSKCRGGMLGVIVGLVLINPLASIVGIVAGAAFFRRAGFYGPFASLIVRLKMWRAALRPMTWRQFGFGMGLDVAKVIFMRDLSMPVKMRRMHSDIIQGLFDGGIYYVSMYLFIGILSISIAPPAIAGALLALMVAGLFIDTQLMPITSVLFWVIVGQINTAGQIMAPEWMLPVAFLILILSINTWGRAFIADLFHGWGTHKRSPQMLEIAYQINPNDSNIAVSYIGALIITKNNKRALARSWEFLNRYDGDSPPEIPYYLLALSTATTDSRAVARDMIQETLKYREHKGARALLAALDKDERRK